MIIVNPTAKGLTSLPAKEISAEAVFSNPLSRKILKHLLEKPDYPRHIAEVVKANEQTVYYHIHLLHKAGYLKKITCPESPMGYSFITAEPAFVVTLSAFRPMNKLEGLQKESRFLEPFIVDGRLDAKIIVGSPDPHGPQKARSRDGYYGIDLALFLGTFLNYIPTTMVKLDTEIQDKDLESNLIVLGGPIVNHVTAKLNDTLPIRFIEGAIYSTTSKKRYEADECAMILKTQNPFAKDKSVLIIAGIRHAGTRSATIAFLKNFDKVKLPNTINQKIFGHVIEGVDLDSDGIVDEVEFLE